MVSLACFLTTHSLSTVIEYFSEQISWEQACVCTLFGIDDV